MSLLHLQEMGYYGRLIPYKKGQFMDISHERFTKEEEALLERFVTNTSSNVFVLKNLPEVIKGALFSRYSRSKLGLRTLLLKEFITNDEESQFSKISSTGKGDNREQLLAIEKAQNFYDRILDGYGDDSIGELGGAHLALENISMLAAKEIEDCRIGGSPLEKSARYVPFDQKVDGRYLYIREPKIMSSRFKESYEKTIDLLFDTYSSLIPQLTEKIRKEFPQKEGVSSQAYTAALRAKVLDCLRGLLPAATMTNMGVFGNGRFYESLIHKLQCQPLQELVGIGRDSFRELTKVIPSFVRRADQAHHTHHGFKKYYASLQNDLKKMCDRFAPKKDQTTGLSIRLVDTSPNAVVDVVAALLFKESSLPLASLKEIACHMTDGERDEVLEAASHPRAMRRHKSPRALEHAYFTFDITADFGIWRDLQRHRMLTQDRQRLNTDEGYYTPDDIVGTSMEEPYHRALLAAKESFDLISEEFPEEAQYIVPLAYNVRWYFLVNLRSLQWLTELRSSAAGHPAYRFVAQEMAKQVCDANPQFKRFFRFVDYEGYTLGRMDQEVRKEQKRAMSVN